MNTQEHAYINGFVKRASEYGFDENEALNILKQSGIADAPAYQTNPTLSEGLNNTVGNIRKALQQPNTINPISAPFMTGSGGTPRPGIGGIPAMAKNLYSHLNPSGETPTISGMNQQSNKIVSNMANGLWNTPAYTNTFEDLRKFLPGYKHEPLNQRLRSKWSDPSFKYDRLEATRTGGFRSTRKPSNPTPQYATPKPEDLTYGYDNNSTPPSQSNTATPSPQSDAATPKPNYPGIHGSIKFPSFKPEDIQRGGPKSWDNKPLMKETNQKSNNTSSNMFNGLQNINVNR